MGKLRVAGTAKKEFECDIMEISLNFQGKNSAASRSVDMAFAQCEKFLRIVSDMGYNINDMRTGNNGTRHRDYSNINDYETSRELVIRLPFDMKVLNDLMVVIKDNDFDVVTNVEYKLSNMEELHRELIKEAVLDSKAKAEMIAETMGQSVKSIKEMNVDDGSYPCNRKVYMAEGQHAIMVSCREEALSDGLKAPVSEESETVDITWVIE